MGFANTRLRRLWAVHDRRDVLSEPDFWTIQLVGAYEHDASTDHDGELNYLMGYAFPLDNPTVVFFETIRDKYANIDGDWVGDPLRDQLTYEAIVAAHECFHRFFGEHLTDLANLGVMRRDAHDTRVTVELTDEQFRALLRTDRPW